MSAVKLAAADLPPELRELLNSPDGPTFEKALDALVREREQHTFRALGVLARELHASIRRLGGELGSESADATVADARKHLEAALQMSDDAAHRNLDFVERMRPQAEALARNSSEMLEWAKPADPAGMLAQQAHEFATRCDDGLAEMAISQSWQDLSGQRIKKVVHFIESVESSLLDLVSLTGALATGAAPVASAKVDSQDEADRLLREFGF